MAFSKTSPKFATFPVQHAAADEIPICIRAVIDARHRCGNPSPRLPRYCARRDDRFRRVLERVLGSRRRQSVGIQVSLREPAELPVNARIKAHWIGPPTSEAAYAGDRGDLVTGPTNGWAKILHALDQTFTLLYKAPRSGRYKLRLETVTDHEPALTQYHRDSGLARLVAALPETDPCDPAGPVCQRGCPRPSSGPRAPTSC